VAEDSLLLAPHRPRQKASARVQGRRSARRPVINIRSSCGIERCGPAYGRESERTASPEARGQHHLGPKRRATPLRLAFERMDSTRLRGIARSSGRTIHLSRGLAYLRMVDRSPLTARAIRRGVRRPDSPTCAPDRVLIRVIGVVVSQQNRDRATCFAPNNDMAVL